MTTPQPLAAELPKYECQNGCGRPLEHILVNVDTGDADRLCGICLMTMMVAAAGKVADSLAPVDDPVTTP
jgi:hypothetical protein